MSTQSVISHLPQRKQKLLAHTHKDILLPRTNLTRSALAQQQVLLAHQQTLMVIHLPMIQQLGRFLLVIVYLNCLLLQSRLLRLRQTHIRDTNRLGYHSPNIRRRHQILRHHRYLLRLHIYPHPLASVPTASAGLLPLIPIG